MYHDYFLRCKQADVPQLYALAELLQVLAQHKDMDGNPMEGSYGVAPGRQGAWEVVGTVYKPTGQMVALELPEEGSMEVPETAPVVDEEGVPYWHANLRIDVDLADHAAELASKHPEIQEGLSNLSRWFVVGEDGKATRPNQPARVWM